VIVSQNHSTYGNWLEKVKRRETKLKANNTYVMTSKIIKLLSKKKRVCLLGSFLGKKISYFERENRRSILKQNNRTLTMGN